MNEEEKEAIKVIKHSLELEKQLRNGYKWKTGFYENLSIEKLLNLVEKQQKEIENYQILKDDIEGHRIAYVDTPEFEEKYISKDKIKEKIEELLSGQEDECRENTEILSKKEIIERYKNNSLLEKLYEGE